MPWFRMYTDFLNDPKLISLAFEDQRHFIGVLALKSDGALDGGIDPALLDRIVAQRLWIDHGVIREVKKRLINAGLVDENWQPVAWDKRQFTSDSSRSRVARHRARKAATSIDGNGACNVTSPLLKRESNAVDTDTDTDTDTEEDKISVDQPDHFEEAWRVYPKRAGGNPKATALKAWSARRKEGVPPDEMLDGAIRYAAFCKATGKLGTEFVMQAATFFGPSMRFRDEYEPPAERRPNNRPSINNFEHDDSDPFAGMRASL